MRLGWIIILTGVTLTSGAIGFLKGMRSVEKEQETGIEDIHEVETDKPVEEQEETEDAQNYQSLAHSVSMVMG